MFPKQDVLMKELRTFRGIPGSAYPFDICLLSDKACGSNSGNSMVLLMMPARSTVATPEIVSSHQRSPIEDRELEILQR
jgi:hypothetical protein